MAWRHASSTIGQERQQIEGSGRGLVACGAVRRPHPCEVQGPSHQSWARVVTVVDLQQTYLCRLRVEPDQPTCAGTHVAALTRRNSSFMNSCRSAFLATLNTVVMMSMAL